MYLDQMDDELRLFVGSAPVPDAGNLGWRAIVEKVFAEGDFRDVPRSRAPATIRRSLRRYDTGTANLLYLITSADAVRARLNIQGYTSAHCRTVWLKSKNELTARWRRKADPTEAHRFGLDLNMLEALTYERWLQLVRETPPTASTNPRSRTRRPWHPIDLLNLGTDPLICLLLLIDVFGGPIWLNVDPLYVYAEDPTLSPHALVMEDAELDRNRPTGRIIVLTEGKSDTRIISAAMRALHPALADAYQFLPFDEFRIEGGASPLARMVKVLSGARISNRLLALFDNDAAGVEAMQSIAALKLPHTVRLMALPDTALARRYPTIGPGGASRMNVNGTAASIELYLGKGPLSAPDGLLRPVRWTEWRPKIGRYQGVVENKDEVVEAFMREMTGDDQPSIKRRRFPDMDKLLRTIFASFQDLTPTSF